MFKYIINLKSKATINKDGDSIELSLAAKQLAKSSED
jgi:hypothetical protein